MTEAVSNVTWQNNTVSSELAECRVIWEPRSRTSCPGLMGEWSGISLEMCPVSWDMKEKRDWSGRFWEEETLLGEKPRQQRTRYFWGTETCLARLGNRCWWSGARSARRRWGGQGRQVSEPATGRGRRALDGRRKVLNKAVMWSEMFWGRIALATLWRRHWEEKGWR